MLDGAMQLELAPDRGLGDREVSDVRACTVYGVSFGANGSRIIENVNVALLPSGVTMIMGPNGAGKSVLVRLLHGMLKPTAGEIRWGHQKLNDGLRKRQAMVFQSPVLLRRSVAANVAFALRLRDVNKRHGCQAFLDRVGLAEHAGKPARLLSGGERQRLAVARALATKPDILFLDEPTASLDPASAALIEDIVLAVARQGVKIVFITHDAGQARRLADEVLFMHRGKLVEHAPATEFFDRPRSREARDYLSGRIVL